MAIFHLSAKIISRSKGQSAVASAAYRAGEKIEDQRLGMTFDYRRKSAVLHSEIFLPAGTPEALRDRAELWNSVERISRRKYSQLAREIEIALPVELPSWRRLELARAFAESFSQIEGVGVDLSIHEKSGNPHAHLMLTTRRISATGLDKKAARDLNAKSKIEEWRKRWETMCNEALEQAQSAERVSSKSNKDRGINQLPSIHIGVAASAMERRGIETDRGDRNRIIQTINAERRATQLRREIIRLSHEIFTRLARKLRQKRQASARATSFSIDEYMKPAIFDPQKYLPKKTKELTRAEVQAQIKAQREKDRAAMAAAMAAAFAEAAKDQQQQQEQQQQQRKKQPQQHGHGGGIGSMG